MKSFLSNLFSQKTDYQLATEYLTPAELAASKFKKTKKKKKRKMLKGTITMFTTLHLKLIVYYC